VTFSNTSFAFSVIKGKSFFVDAQFISLADFYAVRFDSLADFHQSSFFSLADFYQAQFCSGF
jgi:hypothetical protein